MSQVPPGYDRSCKFQSLPVLYLTVSFVLCIVGFQSPWMLVQFGWFVGWVYLRFYKKNTSESFGGQDTYGDRSETFSLVSWFPPFVQYVLTFSAIFLPIHLHPVTLFQFLEISSSRGPAACILFPPRDQMLNWEDMGNFLREQHAQKQSDEGAQCSIQI